MSITIKRIVSKFPCLFNLIFLIPISVISCSHLETQREKGIKHAQEGEWDIAISYLERYVNENIGKFPAAISLSDNPSLRADLNVDEYKKLGDALFYLISSYLGKSGFDWLEIGQKVLEIKDVDTSGNEGKRKVAEKILEIFGSVDEVELRRRIFYLYKAVRLSEKFLYGQENISKVQDIFPEISNFLENRDFYEVVRVVNSVEYLYGKTLIWLSVAQSVFLKQIEYSVKKLAGESISTLPSYCCLFEGLQTGAPPEYPYIVGHKSLEEILGDLSRGIDNVIYGTMVSSAEFSDFAQRYGNVQEDLLEDLREMVNKSCSKWSKNFVETITANIGKILTSLVEKFPGLSTFTVKAEASENKGIWLCPSEDLFGDFLYDVMCSYSGKIEDIFGKYSDSIKQVILPSYSEKVTFQVLFEIPRPGNIPVYKDCQDQEKPQDLRDRTITVILHVKQDIDSSTLINNVCSSKEFKESLGPDSIGQFLSVSIKSKGISLLEEIFRGRFEPQICSL